MVNDPQEYVVDLEKGVHSNVSCKTNDSLMCVIDVFNIKMLKSTQRRNSQHGLVESGTIGV